MPDIFISYKTEERPFAERLAARLTEAGYDVWWDAALLAGQRFEDEIGRALNASRAVIILWSRMAVASAWVKDEAAAALDQGKAIPVIIDDLPHAELLLRFRQIQCPRLAGWDGDVDYPAYRDLLESVTRLAGAATGPRLSPPQAVARLERRADDAQLWAAVSQSPMQSADEYRTYLLRFGEDSLFSELAHIRIAALQQGGAPAVPKPRPKFDWRPAILLPLLAVLIIAVIGTAWYVLKYRDFFVSQAARDAATRCATWSSGSHLDWQTAVPKLTDTAAADCQLAADSFQQTGDYKAMLAMVRLLQRHFDLADTLSAEAIARNSGLGSYVRGLMFELGMSFNPDFDRAFAFYRTALQAGVSRAGGRACMLGIQTQRINNPADNLFPLCQASAEAGDSLGELAMGYIAEYGDAGQHIDDTIAADDYRASAKQGDYTAMTLLGALELRSLSVPHDPADAYGWFKIAADAGYPWAIRWKAIANEIGYGTPVNIPEAGRLYDQAATMGDLISAFLLDFAAPDFSINSMSIFDRREFDRLRAMATPVGQRMIGQGYRRGLAAPPTPDISLKAFLKCADTNALCQLAAGHFYQFGPDGYRSVPNMVDMFTRGAAAGEMHAQFELGLLFLNGQGVGKDLDQAMSLFQLSASQGNVDASEQIKAITNGAPQNP